MLYCHICHAMGFVKARFGNVSTLDCGHAVRQKGEQSESTETTPSEKDPTPRRSAPDREPAANTPAATFDVKSVAKRVADLLRRK